MNIGYFRKLFVNIGILLLCRILYLIEETIFVEIESSKNNTLDLSKRKFSYKIPTYLWVRSNIYLLKLRITKAYRLIFSHFWEFSSMQRACLYDGCWLGWRVNIQLTRYLVWNILFVVVLTQIPVYCKDLHDLSPSYNFTEEKFRYDFINL